MTSYHDLLNSAAILLYSFKASSPASLAVLSDLTLTDTWASPLAFSFISTELGNFDITTSGGSGEMTFPNLPTGIVSVLEMVPNGWVLVSQTCDNLDDPSSITDTIPVEGVGRLHNEEPKRLQTVIANKPPGPGTTYFNPDVIPLFDENNNPTGFSMGAFAAASVP